MNAPVPPLAESLTLAGPAGALEAIVETPSGDEARQIAIVCHPHPQYGGTMTNKVVHMLARSFNACGAPAVRFNYRGVGASQGGYDEGRGETLDALAVIDWAHERWPDARLWVAGFSFGGAVAIKAAAQRGTHGLVTVAPAVRRVAVGGALPDCPWLLVQGDSDEVVDAGDVQHWAQSLPRPPQIALMAGVDHFFNGRLNDLRDTVVGWLQQIQD